MKKISLSLVLFSSLVFSEQIRIIPIDKSYLAKENGGNKPAIDAYSDGVGIVTESNQIIDNSPMNTLVFTYGEKAKNNSSSLKEYSLNNGDNEEKDLANKLGKLGELNNDIEGTACNDNNVQTINDIYINGICLGTNVEGQVCNDENSQTINDKYISGICVGTNVEGQSCTDNNVQTINDKYVNGICIGTNVEGQSCTDNNVQTINDKYVNGICIGTNVEGQVCNDNNVLTINDKYTNGVCSGQTWTSLAKTSGSLYSVIGGYAWGSLWVSNSLIAGIDHFVVNKSSTDIFLIKTPNHVIVFTGLIDNPWTDNISYTASTFYIDGVNINSKSDKLAAVNSLLGSDISIGYSWNSYQKSFYINGSSKYYIFSPSSLPLSEAIKIRAK